MSDTAMGTGRKKSMRKSLAIRDGEPDEMQWRNHDVDGVEKRRPKHWQ
jgi:hypothetical protein